jgi:hypothetical protein
VDEFGGHQIGERARLLLAGCGAGRWRGGEGCGAGQVGQEAPPGGDAFAEQDAQAERERARACVQGGMAQLLVAGVQPAAGGGDLASIRAGARFSSRTAR